MRAYLRASIPTRAPFWPNLLDCWCRGLLPLGRGTPGRGPAGGACGSPARRAASTRGTCGRAPASGPEEPPRLRLHGIFTSRAAAPPRLVSAECPRRGPRRCRDSSPRNSRAAKVQDRHAARVELGVPRRDAAPAVRLGPRPPGHEALVSEKQTVPEDQRPRVADARRQRRLAAGDGEVDGECAHVRARALAAAARPAAALAQRPAYLRRAPVSTESPRHRRDSSPRIIRVAAAASPRLVTTE